MPDRSPPRLDQQLCFALYTASRAFSRAYAPILAPLGLTYPQYLVMLVLWEQDALAINEIGERLMLDSGTLTPLLKRLEKQEMVARRRDAEDQRIVRILLTPKGRELAVRAAQVPDALRCRVQGTAAEGIDLEDLERLREGARDLAKTLLASPASEVG